MAEPRAPKPFRQILKRLDPKIDFNKRFELEDLRLWFQDYRNEFYAIESCIDVIAHKPDDTMLIKEWIGRLRTAIRDFESFGSYVDRQLAIHFPSAGPERISIAAREIMAHTGSQALESVSLRVRALYREQGRIDLKALLALELESYPIAYSQPPETAKVLVRRMPVALKAMELMDLE